MLEPARRLRGHRRKRCNNLVKLLLHSTEVGGKCDPTVDLKIGPSDKGSLVVVGQKGHGLADVLRCPCLGQWLQAKQDLLDFIITAEDSR